MCGITGKIYFDRNHKVELAELKRMTNSMIHRGPDDEGHYIDGNIGLGFRRLSIIDLKTNHQPLSNSDTGGYLATKYKPGESNMSTFKMEVKKGQRFEFGQNWRSFLSTLTDERIRIAETSIKEMLRIDNLNGRTVLDIGSGSGLFSLAARNLGATIHSFDYDPESVACTGELRSRYFPDDPNWVIEEGSVLYEDFIKSLGSFDIVYSWGVLHHTGSMWSAIENAASLVKKNGTLFIAIYNNQGRKSRFWKKVKESYCSGILGKTTVSCIFIPYFFSRALLSCVLRRENVFAGYKNHRGMSITHDWFDWLGGFPFEVATVKEIFHFLRNRGFQLKNIETSNGLGNNQFVFVRESDQ